ncbi:NAD(P)/FAD-dependent oxidoreductase [Halorhodospira sp. 9621]|uniref:NAD(P)/FAD-dependent oxidoreductase n=1 Tax=Halorhodospira TaxID=85108 RepID=UPI00191400C1|nr:MULTISPECIES: NAD(P)/FAD-dependent oxidoreductase [Halorhodospira]MBK5943663.1 aminoacetone oxidase family FAD-binding enzyme [Halorhodospira halophila]MCG5532085.1 NAD(P)/FAD-dependent oxidoreductase [Halorhodospira sp. 9621]
MTEQTDVIVIGAGAAGLMCAATAAGRGRRVVVLDHARKPGRKILMSGGGRCNFTHLDSGPEHFLSANPRFCISALRRYPPAAFLELVERHRVAYEEREPGRLFCRDSARPILDLLLDECARAGVELRMATGVRSVGSTAAGFAVATPTGTVHAEALVVATGGLSIPRMGASGLGYAIARQFGLPVQPTRPALVPLTLPDYLHRPIGSLAGISLPVRMRCAGAEFRDDLLITHHGLSGPAALQVSSYWQPEAPLSVDWLPDTALREELARVRSGRGRRALHRCLERHLPRRLARALCELEGWSGPLQGYSNQALDEVARRLEDWRLTPAGTAGYAKAEVTAGGVDTDALSSRTLAARQVPGLHFIGEVVDVTGQLGGHNFQWAWSSGVATGQAV